MTGLGLMLLMKAYEKGSKVVGTVTKVCTSALWGRVIIALECSSKEVAQKQRVQQKRAVPHSGCCYENR